MFIRITAKKHLRKPKENNAFNAKKTLFRCRLSPHTIITSCRHPNFLKQQTKKPFWELIGNKRG